MNLGAETIAQIQVCEFLRQKTTLPFYHFPNEGKRSLANASILKRMGMTSGVADLFIPRRMGSYSGLWLELKVGSNKPTLAQTQFLAQMIVEGYMSVCIWEAPAAIEFIKTFYEL